MKLEQEDNGYTSSHVVQVSIEFASIFYVANRLVSELILRQSV